MPSPTPQFYTGDVVADLGGVYARSVLVVLPATTQDPGSLVGAVAMDGRGVAGRVVEAGSRSARVLLITDLNSRIPVALGAERRAGADGRHATGPTRLCSIGRRASRPPRARWC